ncbi:MAG TPA: hypothetical protein VF777_15435 [Phycisphaerales bacterium]
MASDSRVGAFLGKARVALRAHAFSVTFWIVLLIVVFTVLIWMKYQQTVWSTSRELTSAAWDEVFRNRIDDLSTILLVLACATGFLLVFPVYDLEIAGKVKELIPLSRGAVSAFLVLVVINWAVYFQAVYRDGGTFLWALGDGKAAVATSWANEMQADDSQRDRLGMMFTEKKQWSALNPEQKTETNARAANAKRIAGLQAVEGMIFLFLLGVWSFLGVLVNIYVSQMGILSTSDRGKQVAAACIGLIAACIVPVVLLGVLSSIAITGRWKEGVESVFLATLSSLAIWGAFFIALCRVLRYGAPVLRWTPGSTVPEGADSK